LGWVNRRQLLSFDALKRDLHFMSIQGPRIDMSDPRPEPAYLYKIMFTLSPPRRYRLEPDGSHHVWKPGDELRFLKEPL